MFSFQGAALSLKRLNEISTTVEISVNLLFPYLSAGLNGTVGGD